MGQPLIHIGYPRAASTWLRNHLFVAGNFLQPFERDDLIARLMTPNPLDFDDEACRAWAREGLQRAEGAGRTPVLSCESLCGSVYIGGWDAAEIAARLNRTFGGAHILIVVREQMAALLSLYNIYVQGGGALPIDELLAPPKKGRHLMPRFLLSYFCYTRVVALYDRLFGKDNVVVLPFEQFVGDGPAFAQRVASAANASVPADLPFTRVVNKALSPGRLAFRRRVNLLRVRSSLNSYSTLHAPRLARALDWCESWPVWERRSACTQANWREQIARASAGQFADDNRRLAARMSMDLAAYGYAV